MFSVYNYIWSDWTGYSRMNKLSVSNHDLMCNHMIVEISNQKNIDKISLLTVFFLFTFIHFGLLVKWLTLSAKEILVWKLLWYESMNVVVSTKGTWIDPKYIIYFSLFNYNFNETEQFQNRKNFEKKKFKLKLTRIELDELIDKLTYTYTIKYIWKSWIIRNRIKQWMRRIIKKKKK